MTGPLRNTTMRVNIEVNSRQLDEANRQIDETIQSTERLERSANQSGRAIQSNANAARENAQQQNNLSNSARRSSASFQEQRGHIDNASRSLSGLKSAAEKLEDTLKMIGVGYFADKILDIGKAAIQTGMDFDKQMSAVQAISGATADQFKAMRDQAISLGASTTKSASEVAAGQLEMAKSGFTVNQTMAAMPGLISASAASGEDMARTAEVMTAALNSFQLSASQAGHVSDVLAQAANDSAADINDLGYAFNYAAGPAHDLGMSLEVVSAATEEMSNAGIKGEQAGTSLREALLRLADPPKEAANELHNLGVKIKDAHGNMLPFSNIIGQLRDKTDKLSNAEKTAALSAIFGTNSVSGMLAVVNAGPEKLDALTKSLQNSDGASAKAAKTMQNNFAGAMEQLKGTIESISINVSDVLTPSLRSAANWLSDMGQKFNELSPTSKQIVVWGSIAVAGVIPVVYVIKKASETISWLKETVLGSHDAFSRFRGDMDATATSASRMANAVQWANSSTGGTRGHSSSSNTASEIQDVLETISENNGSAEGETRIARNAARNRGFFSRIFRRGASAAGDVVQEGSEAANTAGRFGRLASIGAKVGKFSGYLSMGLNAIDLIRSTKDNIVQNIGGMTGSSVGMAIGSAIGSAVAPGIGTAIGGAVGSWAGTYLGSTIGESVQKHHPEIAKQFSNAVGAVKGFFANPLDANIDFGKSISSSTSKAINSYVELETKAKEQLSLLAIDGDKYSKSARDSINSNFQNMVAVVQQALSKTKESTQKDLSVLAKDGFLSDKDVQEIENKQAKAQKANLKAVQESSQKMIQINNDAYNKEQAITSKAEAQINQIKANAAKQRRTLTQQEQNQIKKIESDAAYQRKQIAQKAQQDISKEEEIQRKNVVATLSNSAKQQKLIMGKLADDSGTISAKQAADIVKQSKKARDGAVKEANEKYKEVISAADQEYYVNGTITKKQHDDIVAKAKSQRDEAVKHAQDMHNNVVAEAQKQASGHLEEVDWETGQSLSKWDRFVVSLAEKVNAVTSGINKVLSFFHLGQIKPWEPAGYNSVQSLKTENFKPTNAVEAKQYDLAMGYASGTNFHPGGHSLVGEEGPELAYIPHSGKVALLGANGPEVANIPRGASILPAAQTKAVLNGGLGAGTVLPGYAGGVGDFFKTALDWALHPIDSLKNLVSQYLNFGSNDIGPGNGLGVGILEYYRDKAGSWLKDNLSPFAGLGASGQAGSGQVAQWLTAAMALTNTPSSYLGALMRVAMHESGGNPKAINLWDSNAKAGHPSKGLMQTIDSTFNQYKLPGLDDIWNPVDNAVAAIRYMNARYGSIANVPGVKSSKYVGYKNGGRKFGNGQVLVGENGPELVDLPDGSQIHNNNKTQELLKSKGNVNISFSPVIQIKIDGNSNDSNDSQITRAVKAAMEQAFKDFRAIIGSGVAY